MKCYGESAIEDVLEKYLKYVFFKIANLQNYSCICVQNLRKISVKEFNFSKVAGLKPVTLTKKLNSFAGIFCLVLAQLQNQFLENASQWLPLCAA